MGRTFFEWVMHILREYGSWFLYGAGVTMVLALVGTLVGSCIGLLIGSIRTIPLESHRGKTPRYYALKIINGILSCYVQFFRGTPMIVQAIVVYYGLQEALGIDLSIFTAGLFVVSVNTGAYMAEIVRGGIEAIDPGQTEAAKAIGMTHWQTMFTVILPQTIRNILPATGNEFVINIKDTSVLNVIGVSELYFMAKSVQGVLYRTYEVFLIACVMYLILTLTVTRILKMIEKKLDGPSSYALNTKSQQAKTGKELS